MPPSGFRKRLRSNSPAPTPQKKKAKKSLFEAADAPKQKKSLEENRKLLQELDDDDEDDASSLSEADSDDFEDVPPAKKQKTGHASAPKGNNEDEDEDEMDWEDAIQPGSSTQATPGTDKPEREIGDLSISVNEDGSYVEPLVSISTTKKGPSKRERQIRIQSHCLHVQSLMWHNTVRNSWLNDGEVQKALIDGLTEGVKNEVQRWKEAMGMLSKEELDAKKKAAAAKHKDKGKKGAKSKGGRDWNYDAEHAEQGVPNLSGGDPLLRLLKVLTAYWRKRFTVTAPGLRKQGYKPLRRLRDEIRAWEKDHRDVEESGERIESIQDFRQLAKKCEGSRDVGAQLFCALLRGLGIETRIVANLQPVGFGWSKGEEADAKKSKKKDGQPTNVEPEPESEDEVKPKGPAKITGGNAKKSKAPLKKEKPTRKSSRGGQADPINLDDSDSPLSSAPSEDESEEEQDDRVDDDDDLSVVDVTPATLMKKKPGKKYDRDMAFPNYWVEACSPVSHKYIPVDPIVLSTIASNDELLQTFEPRGKKAEKAKQVMAYTIGFNGDGTAKDVTVRYLKRHQLPGKTKGMRMPVEKVPIYNRRGKVRRYEEYDWFRTLMSIYDRPEPKRTAADDLEEQTDLKPFKPSKSEGKEVEKESLQWYKQSAEFVLEQHLRREEAIKPGAKPVKTFTAGKGDKAKEHPVFRRDDVLVCKTVESWHKEGRELKMGEQPVKQVPMRAVTLIRKREIEDAQRETGEKPTQGLYHRDQTDWIIPPPIKNGHIPRNAFGNIDVYVPTMVPKGAVHLPLKGSAKICKKLEIDFAEACTGFEFGKQRAVPVLTGVVVAKENEGMVRDAWKVEREEQKRKEDTKRTAAALHWWRKMLLGLRVLDRMKQEYTGDGDGEESNPFVLKAKREGRAVADVADGEDEEGGGGFFREGMDVEEVGPRHKDTEMDDGEDEAAGGCFLADGEDDDGEDAGGGFLVEEDPDEASGKKISSHHAPITPISLQSLHKGGDPSAEDESEDDDEEDEVKPPVRKQSKAKSSVNGKAKAKPKAASISAKKITKKQPVPKSKRSKPAPSPPSDDESPLSELSEADSDSDDVKPTPAPKLRRQRSSPQVVVTPGSRSKRPARGAKKTPVRSRYFEHHGGNDGGDDDDPEDEESESEEIVRPRATTSRTRSRRG